jgi:hypothetical protein
MGPSMPQRWSASETVMPSTITCAISRRAVEAVRAGSSSRGGGTRRRADRASDRKYAIPYDDEKDIDEEGSLLRAADLIGQLGDPHYLRKANALYHEFKEIGLNRQFGYESPADVFEKYPRFYWNSVFPHIQAGIRYLNVTCRGRQWIAGPYSNVFRAAKRTQTPAAPRPSGYGVAPAQPSP